MAPTARDLRVAKQIAREIEESGGSRTPWRRVSTLRYLFEMDGLRLSSSERSRMQQALEAAGLEAEPPLTEVDRGGTVRFPGAVKAKEEGTPPEPRAPATAPHEPSAGPEVFISYRREDCQAQANGLNDGLGYRLPEAELFMDIDSIPVGVDFETMMREAVAAADLVLVLIGDNWLDADPDGRRRIDDEEDHVRTEVRLALEGKVSRKVNVLPVLVEGARMPSARELPADIAGLAKINALTLEDARWKSDVGRLAESIKRIVGDRPRAPESATAPNPPPTPSPSAPQTVEAKPKVDLPGRASQGWLATNVPEMDTETLAEFVKQLQEQRGWTAGEIIDLVYIHARRGAIPELPPIGDPTCGEVEVPSRITEAWLERNAPELNRDQAESLAVEMRERGWTEGDIEDHLYAYFRE